MHSLLDISVVTLGWVMVASYIWSTKNHFSAERFPLGAKLVSAAVIGCALALSRTMAVADQPLPFALAGLALQGSSAALFWWAIAASRAARLRFVFDADRPARLLTDGPYPPPVLRVLPAVLDRLVAGLGLALVGRDRRLLCLRLHNGGPRGGTELRPLAACRRLRPLPCCHRPLLAAAVGPQRGLGAFAARPMQAGSAPRREQAAHWIDRQMRNANVAARRVAAIRSLTTRLSFILPHVVVT